MKNNPKVCDYIRNLTTWSEEIKLLRQILQASELLEDFKWMHPCYTLNNKNVALIHEFKGYCAILFHKGILLKDQQRILVKQTDNVQSQRQLRFSSVDEIERHALTIQSYIEEAIQIERLGLKLPVVEKQNIALPEELKTTFAKNVALEVAFNQLTKGRQKGYLLHFTQAKQSKTRLARINKCSGRIMAGKGLNDCICGLSKKMPNCDGSHKFTTESHEV
ncbi:DUF1801 domain-containing protein [Thalassotalea fusca]